MKNITCVVEEQSNFDTATSMSVLNVLTCPVARRQHIELSKKSIEKNVHGGIAYFKVWEGDKTTRVGKHLPNGLYTQMNQPTLFYVDEIQQVFDTTQYEVTLY